MYNKILGAVFLLIGLYVLGGAIFSFTNPDYPGKKALFTGGIQLAIAIFPLILGVKLFRKKAVINNKEE
jgi:hypothetical protein